MMEPLKAARVWLLAQFDYYPQLKWLLVAVLLALACGCLVRKVLLSRQALARLAELASDPRQDHALRTKDGDKLDRGPFVESLARALVRTKQDSVGEIVSSESTGFVIGLTGPWGLGKSSILNMLHKNLAETPHVAVALLNPWLFKDRDELLKAYFNSLREALGRSADDDIRGLLVQLERYRQAIDWVGKTTAALISAHWPVAGPINAVWAKISLALPLLKSKAPRSPEEERKALEHQIALAKVAVVVLIDELDRVEDSEVRAVAQLIKAVGDIRGVSYLVAYDPARVADALGRGAGDDRRISGYHYLEKIIQLPIPVRPLFLDDVEALLEGALKDFDISLTAPANDNQKAILATIKSSIETAREVKRLIGAFSVLEESVRGEICCYDILAYSWLLTKSDAVKEQIVRKLDRLVDDPHETEMIERVMRSKEKSTVDEILGEVAKPYEPLLKLLFPRFGEARPIDEVQDRISRRRNLVRLLYLGNPPGMVRRSDVERIWQLPQAGSIYAELEAMRRSGALPQFLDRLDDLMPALTPAGDQNFWRALSQLFHRDSDWITHADTGRSLAEDAATSLMRLGLRDKALIPRAKKILDDLQAHGDLIIVPLVLRKHMFAYGKTKHGPPRGGDTLWTEQETELVLKMESPRYREAVLSGEALRRLPNVEAIYVLGNSVQWDEFLRQNFTAQLDSVTAIGTLAALLVPPGYSTERDHLNELFEVNQVLQRLKIELNKHGEPADPWVADCLRRLRSIMQGHDPMFPDDDDDEDEDDDGNSELNR